MPVSLRKKDEKRPVRAEDFIVFMLGTKKVMPESVL